MEINTEKHVQLIFITLSHCNQFSKIIFYKELQKNFPLEVGESNECIVFYYAQIIFAF